MKLVILGPPGSGKGTQAKLLSKEFNLKHISTGDLLREEVNKKTELGKEIESIIKQGKLLSDKLVFDLLKKYLPNDNFILDGFPRTVNQAKMLDEFTKIDFIFLIHVDDDVIVERIVNRRICPKCNRIYNLKTNPPMEDNLCDVCKVPLIQRDDDKEDVVRKRLLEYHKQTEPVLSYYGDRAIKINGEQTITQVFDDIVNYLKT